MAIEFLVDRSHEDEKQKLKKILEVIKRKPVKLDKKAWFMRKFILAAMGQYPKKGHVLLKHHAEMLKQLKTESVQAKVQQIKLPEPPQQIILHLPGKLEEPPQPVRILPEAPQRL